MLPEKVKSLLEVRYPGFLFREFQSSWLQICYHEGFDFVFQDLFRVSCYDKVIRAAHQVDLLLLAFCRPCSGVRELLAQCPLQPIKCHVGKDGREWSRDSAHLHDSHRACFTIPLPKRSVIVSHHFAFHHCRRRWSPYVGVCTWQGLHRSSALSMVSCPP